MASDPEIKDGFTLPVWMKTKPTRDFEPFAASPPAPEDTFFYIRYPKSDALFGNTKEQDLPKLVTEPPKEVGAASAFPGSKEKDWSKHTKSCQDVLHGIAPINTAVNSKPKPAGVDDGFKGAGAACGNSVLKVAHQMILSSGRGFTVAAPSSEEPPMSGEAHRPGRRGSKSLPVTPAHTPPSSPMSRRRVHANRYFTSPFEPSEESHGRSWLTAALLGFKKDLATSTSTLTEEDAIETRLQGVTLAESVENLGPAPCDREPMMQAHAAHALRPAPAHAHASAHASAPSHAHASAPAHAFRPKPSELREMNFWSPTSM